MADEGLLLFAHGARDPRWAAPFEAIVTRIRAARPDLPVVLAFLEHATPDLRDGLLQLRSEGSRKVRIVPLFFGRGGHLRDDFPRVLEEGEHHRQVRPRGADARDHGLERRGPARVARAVREEQESVVGHRRL